MKKLVGFSVLFSAWASHIMAAARYDSVPELSSTGSVIALAAIGTGAAIAWERRRNRHRKD